MAEELHFRSAEVKKRHPWGVWGLSIVTLGIYGLVWWYTTAEGAGSPL